jgi:hypothetical protein
MSDDKASSSQTTLREEFVENARRFFKNPKIRSTPLEEQKKFLLSKGVTQSEIDAALDSIPSTDVSLKMYQHSTQLILYFSWPLIKMLFLSINKLLHRFLRQQTE